MNDRFIPHSSGLGYKRPLRILVVEDEPLLAEQLVSAAAKAGYAVDRAGDGRAADLLVHTERHDAIVLDLGLPGIDGLALLRRWRASGVSTPVLILTARSSWHEKVLGIDSGADDYMGKPFQIEEVFARIRAIIRRASGHAQNELRAGALVLDIAGARAVFNDAPVKLTGHEFRLLSYLMHHQHRAVSRTELVEHLYASDLDRDSNTIEVFIARLRRKFGSAAIETMRGLGYRIGTPGGST